MKKGLWIKAGVLLLVIALVIPVVAAGCKEAAPTPTPTPTPAKPTPTPTPTPTPKPEVIEWRFQSTLPLDGTTGTAYFRKFADSVKEKTDGRLKITVFVPNALFKAPALFDAVSKGSLEAAGSSPAYTLGAIPECFVELGLPMAFENADQAYDFYYEYKGGAFRKLVRQSWEEKGIYHASAILPTGILMTKFPITKMADMQGKKIKSFGLYSSLMKAAGATPVSIAGAETYMALQRGTIDGQMYTPDSLETYKFYEVTDYAFYPPMITTLTVNIICNLDAFNKLPKDIQKIVDEEAVKASYNYFAEAKKADERVKKVSTEKGVKWMPLPDDVVKKLREVSVNELWPTVAEKSPRCAEMVKLEEKFLNEKGLI